MTDLDIQDIEEELDSLDIEIGAVKEEVAKNEGSIETLKKQLNELDIKSTEAAAKEIERESKNKDILAEKIIKNYNRLKKNYKW